MFSTRQNILVLFYLRKKEDMFLKGNAHREQSFHIRVQIGTQQIVSQKLIFNVVHSRNRGYTALIAYKKK